MNKNTKTIALILSLILPGLGQVLLGQLLKGAFIYLWFVILVSASIGISHGLITILPGGLGDGILIQNIILTAIALLWLYNLVDIVRFVRGGSGIVEKEKQRVFQEGLEHYINGNLRAAVPKFNEVIKIDSHDVDGILYLGMTYEKIGEREKADKAFQRYFNLVGQLPTFRNTLGKYLTDAKQYGIIELTKQTRSLNQGEYSEMKKHARRGYEVLSNMRGLDNMVARVALQHHERCDGKGYPRGLGVYQLDPIVQLISVIDTYEALTHTRPHRSKKPPDEALKIILDLKDQAFTKDVVKTIIEEMTFYPPGAQVQLNTRETAEVIAVNKEQPLRPRVRIQTDAQGNPVSKTRELNLAEVSDTSISHAIV